jgi:hypothetical protein
LRIGNPILTTGMKGGDGAKLIRDIQAIVGELSEYPVGGGGTT